MAEDKLIELLLNKITNLKGEIESKTNLSELRGEEFNVFSLCGVDHYETVHSRILAEFLSPKGSHGQKGAFLKEFCRMFNIPQFKDDALVTTEVSVLVKDVEGRRFDILIEDSDSICIIENKIFAGEQPEQLKSYVEWLKSIDKKHKTLIFLTPNGRYGVSIADESSYMRVAYLKDGETDICGWLERCRRIAIDAPFVRESISQYVNHIKKIIQGGAIMNEKVSRLMEDNMAAAQLAYENYTTTAVRMANATMTEIGKALGSEWTVESACDFKRKESGALFSRSANPCDKSKGKIYVIFAETNFWNCQVGLWCEDMENAPKIEADDLGEGWHVNQIDDSLKRGWLAWKPILIERDVPVNGMIWDGKFFDRFNSDADYKNKVIEEIRSCIKKLADKIY